MVQDFLREMQKIGRSLRDLDPGDIGEHNVPRRCCFVVASQRHPMDQSAFTDARKAANMFIRADFKMFFFANPEYPEFYAWLTFFLESVTEYLAIVFTGFPMIAPDGGPGDGHPFTIKGRELPPSRIFKLVKEHKHPASRLTFVINGCPAVESWSNGGSETQKLSFSTSGSTMRPPRMLAFSGEMVERVLLLSATPRLDSAVKDRARKGVSHFMAELARAAKADPVKSAAELVEEVGLKMRDFGEEIVGYASSNDVDTETPFLL